MANTHDVFHEWANQTRTSRKSGNVSFEQTILYSYAAIIGAHVTYKGETATLLSKRNYSVTTSRHQSAACQAANHLHVIRVPDIPGEFRYNNVKAGAKELFRLWESEAQSIANKLATARKPARYLEDLEAINLEVTKLAALCRVRIPSKLRKLIDLPDSDNWKEVLGAQAEKTREREEKRKAAQTAENERAIQIWQAFSKPAEGERVSYTRIDRDYLRYDPQSQRIETTQHVQVPVALAKRMYRWLEHTRNIGGCTDCDYTILNYRVRSVRAKYFEVGCHTIYFDQVDRIAKLLGWVLDIREDREENARQCDNCPHKDWQHAREGDARLESETFEIGECYVADCHCTEFAPRG